MFSDVDMAGILSWMETSNTQRTVFPYSPAMPTAPYFRTSKEWPTIEQWPDDPIAAWEALVLPSSVAVTGLADVAKTSSPWEAAQPSESLWVRHGGTAIAGVLTGVLVWLLTSRG